MEEIFIFVLLPALSTRRSSIKDDCSLTEYHTTVFQISNHWRSDWKKSQSVIGSIESIHCFAGPYTSELKLYSRRDIFPFDSLTLPYFK